MAGILVLIMMVTTFLTSRQMILKTGWSQDPQQRMIQKLMLYGIPFSLLLSGWAFPIGVVIYWVTQNGFSFGQQYWVLHKYPPPVTAGNIPMKSTKPGAPTEPKGLLARLRPTPKDGPARTGGGFLRKGTEAAAPAVEPKAIAPRPGAKPVRPKPVAAAKPAADTPADAPQDAVSDATTAGSTGNGKPAANGSKATTGPTIGRMPTVGAVPAKPAGSAGANGSNGAKPADATAGANGAGSDQAPGGAKPAGPAKSTGGTAKSTGGAAKSATAKKAAPRKGSAPRKGGPRR